MGERQRNMGKLKLGKHDHSLTDILKVLLFAIVMLAPFFAILTECLYMICNKNAPTNYTGTQQDVFYNAITNIGNQSIFNWTENTGIYQVINSMCTNLEIGTGSNFLAILLTYWTLNTCIYIIFDIIISVFTKLTHIVNQ